MSEPAVAARIVVPLPLEGDRPRFAPERLKAWGCHSVELRRDQLRALSDTSRRALQHRLKEAGLTAAFINSDGEGWTLDDLREAFALGAALTAEGVVVSAPPRSLEWQQAKDWLSAAVALAEAGALPLLVENRPGTWADTSRNFNQLVDGAASPWLGTAFDPAGFVALREHPFLSAFMSGHLKAGSRLMRIRDAVFEDGRLVRVGGGNAEIAELVSAALARGFDGCFGVGNAADQLEDIRLALDDFGQLLAALGLEDFVS